MFQGTFNYIRDAVEPVLAPVRTFFSDLFADIGAGVSRLLDGVTTLVVNVVKGLVGGTAGGVAAIKALWRTLPEAVGDMMISAANFALRALNDLVNRAIDRINPFIDRINEAARLAHLPELTRLAQVDFGQIQNPYAGQAAATAAVAQQAFTEAFRQTSAAIDKAFRDVGAAIIKAGQTRVAQSLPAQETAKAAAGAARSEVSKSCACPPAISAAPAAAASAASASASSASASAAAASGSASAAAASAAAVAATADKVEAVKPFSGEGLKPTQPLTVNLVQETLSDAIKRVPETFKEAGDAVDTFKNALTQHDWAGAFNALGQTLNTVREAFGRSTMSGFASLAGVVGSVVGGKTGKALAGGMSIASAGLGLGTFLSGSAGVAMAGSIGTALGGGALGAAAANGLMALGAVAGPIALAAGALYAVAKIAGLGGKPSNHAAIAEISGGGYRMVATGKETQETTQAASSAADAIAKAQGAFAAAGISLANTVTKIDLGTRDQTHIFLSNGQELRSARGDAGAAVDTGLRAVLEGATYVSDAQKTLVESALAAGEGFDQVVEKLNAFAEAQKLPDQLDQAILKLKDPKASAEKELETSQQARRDSVQAMADAGYLTAAQLESINGQLATLDSLELAQTLKQFTDAVEGAAKALATKRRSLEGDLAEAMGEGGKATNIRRGLALQDLNPALRDLQTQVWAVQDAAAAAQTAHDNLATAYERESSAFKATIDRFQQFATALREFRDSLSTEGLGAGATASVLRGRLLSTVAAARAGEEGAFEALPGLGRDYLDAAKSQARSAAEYADEVSFVRAATEETERLAQAQVSTAEQQLAALNAQVGGILMVNDSVQTVAAALGVYQQAIVDLTASKARAQTVANQGLAPVGGVLNDEQTARYLAQNWDLSANWNDGGVMRALGPTLFEAAREHYRRTGQFEIAGGTRGALAFATGGSFEVAGAPGQDQNLIPLRLTRGEVVNIRRPGVANDNAAVVGAVQRLEARLGDMADALLAANAKLASLEKLNRKWDGDGMPQTRNTGTQ